MSLHSLENIDYKFSFEFSGHNSHFNLNRSHISARSSHQRDQYCASSVGSVDTVFLCISAYIRHRRRKTQLVSVYKCVGGYPFFIEFSLYIVMWWYNNIGLPSFAANLNVYNAMTTDDCQKRWSSACCESLLRVVYTRLYGGPVAAVNKTTICYYLSCVCILFSSANPYHSHASRMEGCWRGCAIRHAPFFIFVLFHIHICS